MRGEKMKNNKSQIIVKNQIINVIIIDKKEYISLTDLARYADEDDPRYPIQNWMRNMDVLSYLGLWETIHNSQFKRVEFDTLKREAGSNKFKISPQKWIKTTDAIGIISKSGNNGGTYARSDIALKFASWLSPEFKLYVIQEFQRLKKKESYEDKTEWKINRLLSKINYTIHTNAIKEYIVPSLTEKQLQYIYATEADILNVALFGMTAKEWRLNNPHQEGNIRDYSDIIHLIILNNLQVINAELIEENISQRDRLIKLNYIAKRQMKILTNNKVIKDLDKLK